MTNVDALVARRRAYALLGTILVEGVDPRRLKTVQALPPLAEHLSSPVDLDGLAAEHYALFGHEVHPFAGVFVDEAGLVGGGSSGRVVRQAHAVVGLDCPDDPGPDHLGVAVRLMAALTDAEIDARAHDDGPALQTLHQWQRTVLDEALLPWLPPFHAAIVGQPASLWTRAVALVTGLLAGHRAEDPTAPSAVEEPGEPPSLDAVLDEPGTGLSTLARILATPARCGVYLARRDLARLALHAELPRGFGGREGMMERLLRSASEYATLPAVIDALSELLQVRQRVYATLSDEPGLGPHVGPWQRRLAATERLLTRLERKVRAITGPSAANETPVIPTL